MPHIVIISSSVRKGRVSHRTALYFRNFIETNDLGSVEILDLYEYNFPLFEERLRFIENPSDKVLDFAAKVKTADGIIIVTPEYNGGYPASLKNVIDLLYDEWRRKPIAIASNSGGPFGAAQVLTSLQFSLWKIGAWTVPAIFQVAKVQDTFNENGVPSEKIGTDKRATVFINELLWCIEAKKRMSI
ncbi:NADPH azoreductase [compost metagenome]